MIEDLKDGKDVLCGMATITKSYTPEEIAILKSSKRDRLKGWAECIRALASAWKDILPLPKLLMPGEGTILDGNKVVAVSAENFAEIVCQMAEEERYVVHNWKEVLGVLRADMEAFVGNAIEEGGLRKLRENEDVFRGRVNCMAAVARMWGTRPPPLDALIMAVMENNGTSPNSIFKERYGHLSVVAITVEGSPTDCFPLVDSKDGDPCLIALQSGEVY